MLVVLAARHTVLSPAMRPTKSPSVGFSCRANAELSGERLLASKNMLIGRGTRQPPNHDDFHNIRARPLQRLVSVPNIAGGGFEARRALHDVMEGDRPSSVRSTRSSPGEEIPDRPTAVHSLF